eukprot:Nk52_evm6s1636 gene=Nk52_evmTU6s1636
MVVFYRRRLVKRCFVLCIGAVFAGILLLLLNIYMEEYQQQQHDQLMGNNGTGKKYWDAARDNKIIKVCPELEMKKLLLNNNSMSGEGKGQSHTKGALKEGSTSTGVEKPSRKDKKYLVFLPDQGLNNVLYQFERACALAALLNRTLAVPYMTNEHIKDGELGSRSTLFESVQDEEKRKGMESRFKFEKVKFKSYDKLKDQVVLKQVAFRSYFRFVQPQHPKATWRFAKGVTDMDPEPLGAFTGKAIIVRHLEVEYLEDDPEFWASQTFRCAKREDNVWHYSFEDYMQQFDSLDGTEQFVCAGFIFRLDDRFSGEVSAEFTTSHLIGFSNELEEIGNNMLQNARMMGTDGVGRKYHFMAVHLRRGDFAIYCKHLVGDNVEKFGHCFPSQAQISMKFKEMFVKASSFVSALSGIVHKLKESIWGPFEITSSKTRFSFSKERTNFGNLVPKDPISQSMRVYVATNEKESLVLEQLAKDYGAVYASDLMMPLGSRSCPNSFPFARVALDMYFLSKATAFLMNRFSTLSARAKFIQEDTKKAPSLTPIMQVF